MGSRGMTAGRPNGFAEGCGVCTKIKGCQPTQAVYRAENYHLKVPGEAAAWTAHNPRPTHSAPHTQLVSLQLLLISTRYRGAVLPPTDALRGLKIAQFHPRARANFIQAVEQQSSG